jgi:hypothetical protein
MSRRVLLSLAFLALLAGAALSQQLEVSQPAGKEKDPKQGEKDKKQPDPAPKDVFSSLLVPRSDATATRSFNPVMIGDSAGAFARVRFRFPITTTVNTTFDPNLAQFPPTTVTTTTTGAVNLLVHVPIHGAAKVGENTSPRPQDRVFGAYNFYNDLRGPVAGATVPVRNVQTTTVDTGIAIVTTTSTSFIPGTPYVDLHREVFGFEKTFLDGRASIEVRLPILQQPSGANGFAYNNIGDLTIVGRYAFILDGDTGDVLSAGLAVTAPTGRPIQTIDGPVRTVLIQPWFGYIWNADRFFVQGIHSIAIPTDSRDVTLLYNDFGVGYWLYRGDRSRAVNFLVPAVEAHVTTPLTHRNDPAAPIIGLDTVNLTAGLHVGVLRNSVLTVGVATPITGPRPFGVEAFALFNWRY